MAHLRAFGHKKFIKVYYTYVLLNLYPFYS